MKWSVVGWLWLVHACVGTPHGQHHPVHTHSPSPNPFNPSHHTTESKTPVSAYSELRPAAPHRRGQRGVGALVLHFSPWPAWLPLCWGVVRWGLSVYKRRPMMRKRVASRPVDRPTDRPVRECVRLHGRSVNRSGARQGAGPQFIHSSPSRRALTRPKSSGRSSVFRWAAVTLRA